MAEMTYEALIVEARRQLDLEFPLEPRPISDTVFSPIPILVALKVMSGPRVDPALKAELDAIADSEFEAFLESEGGVA